MNPVHLVCARVVALGFMVRYYSKVMFEQACSTCPIPFQEQEERCLGEVVQPINHFDTFTVSRLVSTTLIPRSGPGTRSHRAASWECLCPFWRDQHTFRESEEEFNGAWQVRDSRGECDHLAVEIMRGLVLLQRSPPGKIGGKHGAGYGRFLLERRDD